MAHIRQKNSVGTNSYTIVDLTGYSGELSNHPTIVNNSDLFEISEDAIPENHQKVNPSYEVPQEVALWQIMAILNSLGLESTILTALESLPEPTKSIVAKFMKHGTIVERNSATVAMVQQVISYTNEQMDHLFIQCKSIKL